MRQFYDLEYMSQHSYVGFSLPGFIAMDGYYAAHIQAEPVLRITCGTQSAAWLDVAIESDGRYYGIMDTLTQTIKCRGGQTVYVPLGEAFHSLFAPSMSGILLSPQDMVADATVRCTLLDSTLTGIGSVAFSVMFYDCLGAYSPWGEDESDISLPDSFRLMGGGEYNYITVPLVQTGDEDPEFAIYDAEGESVTRYSANGGAMCLRLSEQSRPSQLRLGRGKPLFARMTFEGKCHDTRLLTWWSPLHGGWKSIVADIVGVADEVTERRDYVRGFQAVAGVAGRLGETLRLQALTYRDWLYYRDIYLSDRVLVRAHLSTGGGTESGLWLPVKVAGNMPMWRLGGSARSVDVTIYSSSNINEL